MLSRHCASASDSPRPPSSDHSEEEELVGEEGRESWEEGEGEGGETGSMSEDGGSSRGDSGGEGVVGSWRDRGSMDGSRWDQFVAGDDGKIAKLCGHITLGCRNRILMSRLSISI